MPAAWCHRRTRSTSLIVAWMRLALTHHVHRLTEHLLHAGLMQVGCTTFPSQRMRHVTCIQPPVLAFSAVGTLRSNIHVQRRPPRMDTVAVWSRTDRCQSLNGEKLRKLEHSDGRNFFCRGAESAPDREQTVAVALLEQMGDELCVYPYHNDIYCTPEETSTMVYIHVYRERPP